MRGLADCPVCGGEGWRVAKPGVNGYRDTVTDCECVPRARSAKRGRRVERGVPTKFRTLTSFENSVAFQLPASVREVLGDYVEQYERVHLPRGRGIWLTGPTRTGKTVAACIVAQMLGRRRPGGSVAYWPLRRLLHEIRDTYDPASEERTSALLARFVEMELLVLDDIGAVRGTDHTRDIVTDILCERNDHVRPTIVTTDLTDDELRDRYDARVVERLRESCVRIELPGAGSESLAA